NVGLPPPLVGGGPVLNAATCINHPLEATGVGTLYVPAEAATISSTISASGCVMTSCTHPGAGPLKWDPVIPAAKSNSLAWLVVTGPLSASSPVPEAEAPASKGLSWLSPEYSVTRRSTYFAGMSNLTVTVLGPETILVA